MGVVLGACTVVSAAACGDAPPTASVLEPAGARSLAVSGADAGGGRGYLCYVSRRTPEGPYRYSYARRLLHFPQKMIAPDGRLTMYRLRLGGPGGELSGAANCLIPATWEAVAHVNRLFGVREQFSHLMGTAFTMEQVVTDCPNGYTGTYPDCKKDVTNDGGGLPGTSVGEPGHGGGGDDSTPPEPCNTSDETINADPVEAGFGRIWTASNANAADQFQRREKGGFIIQTPQGLTVQDFPASWISGPCSIDVPAGAQAPAGTVGVIHTHPWKVGEQQISCGPVLPGTSLYQNYPGTFTHDDQLTLQKWGDQLGRTLTGYILDKDGIRRFTETSVTPDSFNRCAF